MSAALVIAARVKGIDPVKLWPIAKELVMVGIGSSQEEIVLHGDNDLAIMNAMFKLKLDKTSSMRHEIIRKKVIVQFICKLYNEAKETLESWKKDWEADGVEEDTKDEMNKILKEMHMSVRGTNSLMISIESLRTRKRLSMEAVDVLLNDFVVDS